MSTIAAGRSLAADTRRGVSERTPRNWHNRCSASAAARNAWKGEYDENCRLITDAGDAHVLKIAASTDAGAALLPHLFSTAEDSTAGANGNVASFSVPGGFSIPFTRMRVTRHDGRPPFHMVGVAPDIAIEPTLAGIRAGRDEVLERALELLRVRP